MIYSVSTPYWNYFTGKNKDMLFGSSASRRVVIDGDAYVEFGASTPIVLPKSKTFLVKKAELLIGSVWHSYPAAQEVTNTNPALWNDVIYPFLVQEIKDFLGMLKVNLKIGQSSYVGYPGETTDLPRHKVEAWKFGNPDISVFVKYDLTGAFSSLTAVKQAKTIYPVILIPESIVSAFVPPDTLPYDRESRAVLNVVYDIVPESVAKGVMI